MCFEGVKGIGMRVRNDCFIRHDIIMFQAVRLSAVVYIIAI